MELPALPEPTPAHDFDGHCPVFSQDQVREIQRAAAQAALEAAAKVCDRLAESGAPNYQTTRLNCADHIRAIQVQP